jgi:2-amino-4-hydroxy-6-hydroxymethyldihydropteridine diphosphokinase
MAVKVTKVIVPTEPASSTEKCPTLGFFLESGHVRRGKLVLLKKLVYLSLGSNIGDRAGHLKAAIKHLESLGNVVAVSSFYETEPVEVTAQPWFLNGVVALETEKMPRQLIAAILDLEQEMGRRRVQKKGPRTIDIDILLFGNSVIDMPGLTVPHPAMHERRFVLQPLAEIAPDVRHPVLKKSVRELLADLPSGQAVRKKN